MIVKYSQNAPTECGAVNFCSWTRAREWFHKAAGVRSGEHVESLVLTERGIEIHLARDSKPELDKPKVTK